MKKLLLLAFITISFFDMKAQLIFNEPFDYTTGDLEGQGGWTVAQGSANNFQVVSPGLSFSGYPLSGADNAANIQGNASDIEQKYINIGSTVSGTIYTSFLINVSAAPTAEEYILGFSPSSQGGTFLAARFFIKSDASSNLAFGIDPGLGTSAEALTGFTYSMNTTYLIVLKYNIVAGADNNQFSLFVIPTGTTIPASEPSTTLGPLTVTASSGEDIDDIDKITLIARNASVQAKIDGIEIASAWSDLFTITGITSPVNSLVFVYPNPTSDFLYFSTKVSAELMDTKGRILITEEETESLNLTSLSKGLYIVNCRVGERKESKLVMVK